MAERRTRRRFTAEFKVEAVKRLLEIANEAAAIHRAFPRATRLAARGE